jgi:hypothetical protein
MWEVPGATLNKKPINLCGICLSFPHLFKGTAGLLPGIGRMCFMSYSLNLFSNLPAILSCWWLIMGYVSQDLDPAHPSTYGWCSCLSQLAEFLSLYLVLPQVRYVAQVRWRSRPPTRTHTICFPFSPWSECNDCDTCSLFQDELTTLNVKHGFTTVPQLSDEFGTARNCNITASKVRGKKEKENTCVFSFSVIKYNRPSFMI